MQPTTVFDQQGFKQEKSLTSTYAATESEKISIPHLPPPARPPPSLFARTQRKMLESVLGLYFWVFDRCTFTPPCFSFRALQLDL